MRSAIAVLPARAGDAEALAALHRQTFEEAWDVEAFIRLLAEPSVFVIIACDSEAIAGFAVCRIAVDECEVLSCAVAPALRRRGIGRRLLATAFAQAARRGGRRVFLEVADDNTSACALYTACGFRAVGRRRRYYARAGGAADALIMTTDL